MARRVPSLALLIAATALACEPPPGKPSPPVSAPAAASASVSASASASAPVPASVPAPVPVPVPAPVSVSAPAPAPPPCPPEAKQPEGALAWVSANKIQIAKGILFEFDKDRVRPESFPVLDAVVAILRGELSFQIRVEGHLDPSGVTHYGRDLSKARAQAVRKYLVAKGVDPARVIALGYGTSVPIVPNDTPENRKKNRRIELVLLCSR